MRRAFALGVLVCFLVLNCGEVAAGRTGRDEGTIDSMSESVVAVKGVRGVHILEFLGECSWCEEGMEVIVTFGSYGRASLSPRERSGLIRPVKAMVIKDGREGD